jgi:hypothetical protein
MRTDFWKIFSSVRLVRPSRRTKQRRRFRLESLERREMFSVSGDFNGDGFDDLAIGASGGSVSPTTAGEVNVIYGSASKLTTAGNQLWTLDSPGINGVAHVGDRTGDALAVGDFNDDGFDDLAIGSTLYKVNGVYGAGAVNVIYGSSSGLTAAGDQQFTRDSSGINGNPQPLARFGGALTAGDFNGDGRDDLAIGSPTEKINGYEVAGAVNVLFGGSNGLKTSGDQFWTQDSPGINGAARTGDQFGSALAAGDFDGNGCDDLAIGVRWESVSGKNQAGAVNVIYGNSDGLTNARDQRWHRDVTGVAGTATTGAEFGFSLAVGHFNSDDFADLAIGAPSTVVNMVDIPGAVNVFFGSSERLSATTGQYFTAATLGLPAHDFQKFGATLAAGDFRKSGRDQLAIGVPSYDVGGISQSGTVVIVANASFGLTNSGPLFFSQNSAGVAGVAEADDRFGSSLVSGDYDGDGFFDLVIGAAAEDVNVDGADVINGGVVHVLYGKSTGLSSSGSQLFSQNTTGILGTSQVNDNFGVALA